MRASKASERLRRLLTLVPYAIQHPGTPIAELGERFGVAEDDLLADLNLLFMSGLPPYGPGDLIDVLIEDGKVWIEMADYFSRPVRLTRSEAVALYLQGKALLGTPGLPEANVLASALTKLEGALGAETLGELAGKVAAAAGASAGQEHVERLMRAADDRERVEIEHYSAGRDEVRTRRIDPEEVFSAIGNWYVVAWDHLEDDERMFRVDRIRSVTPTGERFEPRGLQGAGRPLYSRSEQDIAVKLSLGPGARWVAEYYETERARETEDGRLEVVLPTKQLNWVAKLVVRLGGEASVVEPAELGELVREVAERSLARYQKSP